MNYREINAKTALSLASGGRLTDLFEDTGIEGNLRDRNIPTFITTRAVKE